VPLTFRHFFFADIISLKTMVRQVLRLTNPNFYLLDEPKNHLDIEVPEALEEELIAHEASCLLVSHDRSFLRNVGNRFWWIDRKKLIEVESPEAFLNGDMGAP